MKNIGKFLQLFIIYFIFFTISSCKDKCVQPVEPEDNTDTGNYALTFDGVNDFAETPGYPLVNTMDTGNFTIEAYFKAAQDQTSIYPALVSNRSNGSGAIVFLAPGSNPWEMGKPWINIQNVNYPCSACPSLTDNTWHHLAIERMGNVLRYYVDGSKLLERAIDPSGNNISSGGNIRLGHDVDNSSNTYFKGSISEVRIWNYAREEKIAAYRNKKIADFENGLVAYWNLNEGKGQRILNKGGNPSAPVNGTLGTVPDADDSDPEWTAVP